MKPIYFLMEYTFLQGIHFAEYLLLVFEILEMFRECRETEFINLEIIYYWSGVVFFNVLKNYL